jgi:hypothetical protein
MLFFSRDRPADEQADGEDRLAEAPVRHQDVEAPQLAEGIFPIGRRLIPHLDDEASAVSGNRHPAGQGGPADSLHFL